MAFSGKNGITLPTLMGVLSGIAVILILAAGIWYFTGNQLNVMVPDVAGITQDEAIFTISKAGLTVGTITSEEHDTVPNGIVISQSLAPGTFVAGGSEIDLFVSSGLVEAFVPVPDVADMRQADAEPAIPQSVPAVETITIEEHDIESEGSVISPSIVVETTVAGESEEALLVQSDSPQPYDTVTETQAEPLQAFNMVDIMEARAIAGLRTIGAAQVAHSAVNKGSYGTIEELIRNGFLESRFNGVIDGYEYVSGRATSAAPFTDTIHSFIARPVISGPTGRYLYGIGLDMVVRYMGKDASLDDNVPDLMCCKNYCNIGDPIGLGCGNGEK